MTSAPLDIDKPPTTSSAAPLSTPSHYGDIQSRSLSPGSFYSADTSLHGKSDDLSFEVAFRARLESSPSTSITANSASAGHEQEQNQRARMMGASSIGAMSDHSTAQQQNGHEQEQHQDPPSPRHSPSLPPQTGAVSSVIKTAMKEAAADGATDKTSHAEAGEQRSRESSATDSSGMDGSNGGGGGGGNARDAAQQDKQYHEEDSTTVSTAKTNNNNNQNNHDTEACPPTMTSQEAAAHERFQRALAMGPGFGLGLDTGTIPAHLLWRPPSSSSSSSSSSSPSAAAAAAPSDGQTRARDGTVVAEDTKSKEQEEQKDKVDQALPQQASESVSTAAVSPLGRHGDAAGAPSHSGGGSGEFRTGDWVCVSDKCSFHNFAQNLACLGCGAAKPVGGCGDSKNAPGQGRQSQVEGATGHAGDRQPAKSSSLWSQALAPAFQPRAREASQPGTSSTSPVAPPPTLASQMQDLIIQHRHKMEGMSPVQGASSSGSGSAGTLASQWAPGGSLASSADAAVKPSYQQQSQQQQQQGQPPSSYFSFTPAHLATAAVRLGGPTAGAARGAYGVGTSTPPPLSNVHAYASSAGIPSTASTPAHGIPQVTQAAIDAFRTAVSSSGSQHPAQLQLHQQGGGTASYNQGGLPQHQAATQRGGTVTPAMVSSLYQLQLQHAAMKNASGMPLPQSSGPLARMQALTSAFGGMPPATTAAQSQAPLSAQAPAYSNAVAGGALRFSQPGGTHSAQGGAGASSYAPSLPMTSSGPPTSYGMQAPVSMSMAGPSSSAAAMTQLQASQSGAHAVQLPPLDWTNLSKSNAPGGLGYPSIAPYRSAHTQTAGGAQPHASLPLNPAMNLGMPSSTSAGLAAVASSATENAGAAAGVGVGLNLPGGVEGLAIKQPWLSTAPSNAATAARLATLGIGIGPGVNPNVASTAPAGAEQQGGDRRKTGMGNGSQGAADAGGSNPPIVNTGNSGPMCVQPGDWVCSSCGFVNWRRRRVCLRCFPFAEGNETAASLANGAILAAQLAAGVSPSKVDTASLLKSPARSREARAREQAALEAQNGGGGPGVSAGVGANIGVSAAGPAIGLGLNLGSFSGSALPRYPSTASSPALGMPATTAMATGTTSMMPQFLLKPFGSAPSTASTSPHLPPAIAPVSDVPNWAHLAQSERFAFDSPAHGQQPLSSTALALEWQRRTSAGATRTVSGPAPTTRAPGGPTTMMGMQGTHVRQSSYNTATSFSGSDILSSGSMAGSVGWHASPSSMGHTSSLGHGGVGGAGGLTGTFTPSTHSVSSGASMRNIWGSSPPRNISGNKLLDEDDQEVSVPSGPGGAGAGGQQGGRGSIGSDPLHDGQGAVWRPKPIGSRDSTSASGSGQAPTKSDEARPSS